MSTSCHVFAPRFKKQQHLEFGKTCEDVGTVVARSLLKDYKRMHTELLQASRKAGLVEIWT